MNEGFFNYIFNEKKEYQKELEYLKYEIDRRFYHYGDHFKSPFPVESLKVKKKKKFNIIVFIKKNIKSFIRKNKLEIGKIETGSIVVYKGYSLNADMKNLLQDEGFQLSNPIYNSNSSYYKRINDTLATASLSYLISDEFLEEIRSCYIKLLNYYKDDRFKLLIVPYDMPPMERMIIDVFKELGKKSMIYLHGLPSIYNLSNNFRTDYLIVWGKKIKENYVSLGANGEKILIYPNVKYRLYKESFLRFSFENILVLSVSLPGAQYERNVIIPDRSNCVRYFYEVESVLRQLGIKHASFRPHPGENPNWYCKYLSSDFYSLDTDSLATSLSKRTLVIGPSSTCLLDSIFAGVNYTCYEPLKNEKKYDSYFPFDPFDGSNPKIPVAQNPEELKEILDGKLKIDPTVFWEYNDESSVNLIQFLKKICD